MRHIRSMTVHSGTIMPNICLALSASLAGNVESVFPKLRYLHWFDREEFLCIQSPRLTFIHIYCELSITTLSFLASIPRTCPALKDLNVRCYDITQSVFFALSGCIHSSP
jgi:hypothetical protein